MKLNQLIRDWRERAALSQADLARSCGVSPEAVSQWEAGSTPRRRRGRGRTAARQPTTPTLENLERVAAACGVSLAEFLQGAR